MNNRGRATMVECEKVLEWMKGRGVVTHREISEGLGGGDYRSHLIRLRVNGYIVKIPRPQSGGDHACRYRVVGE